MPPFALLRQHLRAAAPAGRDGLCLWPGQCRICQAWPARSWCSDCLARFAPPCRRCQRCALPLPAGPSVCGSCLRQPPPLQSCLAALDYQWPWSHAIARWKYQADTGLGAALARLLASQPGVAQILHTVDAVLPLPSAAQRVAERGQHPAAVLAHALAPAKVRRHWLLRTRNTPPQRGLKLAQRQRNVRGAFAVPAAAQPALQGLRLLLVDDVMTTGATLHEASRTLLRAGAASVHALVLARTP